LKKKRNLKITLTIITLNNSRKAEEGMGMANKTSAKD
jgi:hypothetical protein